MKYKKNIKSMFILLLLISLIGCNTTDTSTHDDPDHLYRQNSDIDMIVYNGYAYIKASDIDWVMEMKLTIGDELGQIIEKYDPKLNKTFSATKLKIGTKVYISNEERMILIIEKDGITVPYLMMIEG